MDVVIVTTVVSLIAITLLLGTISIILYIHYRLRRKKFQDKRRTCPYMNYTGQECKVCNDCLELLKTAKSSNITTSSSELQLSSKTESGRNKKCQVTESVYKNKSHGHSCGQTSEDKELTRLGGCLSTTTLTRDFRSKIPRLRPQSHGARHTVTASSSYNSGINNKPIWR